MDWKSDSFSYRAHLPFDSKVATLPLNLGGDVLVVGKRPTSRLRHQCAGPNAEPAQIRELWQYAGEDELPPDSLLQAHVEALRILRIDVPLSAKRQFQLFCSEHFPGLANILDCLAADQLWALLSMRVQLANSDQLQAQSAAVRFGGLGRRYVLVAFNDRPVGLLSHADGSGLLPEARPKLTALSWEEIRLALMLDIGSN